MKLYHLALAAALALAAPTSAWATQCPGLMAKIDTLLAANPGIDAEMLKEIKELREDGEKQHAAGEHDKSVETLNQALLLLGGL